MPRSTYPTHAGTRWAGVVHGFKKGVASGPGHRAGLGGRPGLRFISGFCGVLGGSAEVAKQRDAAVLPPDHGSGIEHGEHDPAEGLDVLAGEGGVGG